MPLDGPIKMTFTVYESQYVVPSYGEPEQSGRACLTINDVATILHQNAPGSDAAFVNAIRGPWPVRIALPLLPTDAIMTAFGFDTAGTAREP
jgi:hypothetical protein